jgi:hypothetical protein
MLRELEDPPFSSNPDGGMGKSGRACCKGNSQEVGIGAEGPLGLGNGSAEQGEMKNGQGLVCGSLRIEEGKSTYAMYVGGGIYLVLSKARKNDASLSWSVVGRVIAA